MYKVGDKVRIKSIDWYNKNKDKYGTIMFSTDNGDFSFTKEDAHFCGQVVTIEHEGKGYYLIVEDDRGYFWIDEMIEGPSTSKYNEGDFVGVYDYETDVRIEEVRWDGSSYSYKVYLAGKEEWLYDDDITYKENKVIEEFMEEKTKVSTASNPIDPKSNANCLIQKKIDEIKPKFKIGDKITNGKTQLTILNIISDKYIVEYNFGECGTLYFNAQDYWKLVEKEIKPKFKVGDRIITDTNMKGTIIEVIEKGWYRVEFEPYNNIPQPNSVVPEENMSLAEEEIGLIDGFSSRWINEFNLPNGYIFKDENGNVINATKIVLEKKHDDKLKLESTKKVREYWSEYAKIFIEIYDDKPNECVFTHLWVVDGQRQKGHGKRALIEAETIAKELGCHTAYLKVETNSWMHHWYLRCGYQWYENAPDNYTWLTKDL